VSLLKQTPYRRAPPGEAPAQIGQPAIIKGADLIWSNVEGGAPRRHGSGCSVGFPGREWSVLDEHQDEESVIHCTAAALFPLYGRCSRA
jgi:hypothetical protein